MKRALGFALLAWLAPAAALAVPYHYVNWTTANPSGGTASGTITLPDTSVVTVNFEVFDEFGNPGTFFFAQTDGTGTNYWNPITPYISTEVDNAPPDTDIIALVGGNNSTYKVTLSEAIKDPIMAIVSLGNNSNTITYDFDSPFTIVSQGAGFWGGGPTSLVQLPGDILQGTEGHGTIQFIGTFDTFSWVAPNFEASHGFTFGIRTTEAIEPSVPEPGMLGMLGLALAGLGIARRRTR
jgi:hypothetical protein